ncbi:glycosyltransferase family 25 protein [Halenospora varia]|nr:glycosyltransferase family 25 protein [Halenospora varia]
MAGVLTTFLLFASSHLWRNQIPQGSWRSGTLSSPSNALQSTSHVVGANKTDLLDIERAGNATMGFQKVLVIGLKERTDKKDLLTLQASLTGIDLSWIEAVHSDDIKEKGLPPAMYLQGNFLASWRSHINAVRSIIENRYASAMIMEDDMDWDVRIRTQMQDFARGVRYLTSVDESKKQHSPYGDDWDVLWPGHCGEYLPENDDGRRFVINDDETVAPKTQQPTLKEHLAEYPEHTRILHKAGAPICTFAYALSARGAAKVLYYLGTKGQGANYDNALAFMCRDGNLNLKCYSVEPFLFQHHRAAGPLDKDSDNLNGEHSQVRETAFTESIVWSARLNLEKMILGDTNYTMQW